MLLTEEVRRRYHEAKARRLMEDTLSKLDLPEQVKRQVLDKLKEKDRGKE